MPGPGLDLFGEEELAPRRQAERFIDAYREVVG